MSIFTRLRQQVAALENWYLDTPERALSEAYQAALKIQQIENEHFGGRPIGPGSGYSPVVLNYFEAELQKLLKMARMRLTEFKASNRFMNSDRRSPANQTRRISAQEVTNSTNTYTLDKSQYSSAVVPNNSVNSETATPSVVEKLKFVENTLARYRPPTAQELSAELNRTNISPNQNQPPVGVSGVLQANSLYNKEIVADDLPTTKLDGSSFVPRSILRTADRFRREVGANLETEEQVIKDFRNSKTRSRIALRFLLLLIILPLLTQQISKTMVFGPIIDHFQVAGQYEQFINQDIEERVFAELERYQTKLRFQALISEQPMPGIAIEAQVKEKALELSEKYRWEITEPLKNILSDILGCIVFILFLFKSQPQIAIFKSFLDEIVYGLSDSAKAFILILLTDVFVGFHSPHGWEVIMHNVLEHFGLPRNEEFIDMFIATFPVMLDTVFKYWIFRYLNQVSPSAVATYRNMNE